MEKLASAQARLQTGSSEERCQACKDLGDLHSPAAIDLLLATLETDDPHVFEAAVQALIQTETDQTSPALISVLKKEDAWGIRHRIATTALGKLSDPIAIPVLTDLAATHHWQRVREAAAVALGHFVNPEAVESLLQLLQDTDYAVQCAAARSLGQTGSTEASTDLCAILFQEDHWGLLHDAALEALADIKDPTSVPNLVDLLKKPGHSTVFVDKVMQVFIAAGSASVGTLLSVIPFADNLTKSAIAHALNVLKEPVLSKLPGLLRGIPDEPGTLINYAQAGEIRFVSVLVEQLQQLQNPTTATESLLKTELKQVLAAIHAVASTTYKSMYCRQDLSRFTEQTKNDVHFFACRSCGTTYHAIQTPHVTALLDHSAPDVTAEGNTSEGNQALTINWFANQELFDFDAVEIGNVTDEEVIRFCMMVSNDTDGFRQLENVPCLIRSPDIFQENSLRVLARTFR